MSYSLPFEQGFGNFSEKLGVEWQINNGTTKI